MTLPDTSAAEVVAWRSRWPDDAEWDLHIQPIMALGDDAEDFVQEPLVLKAELDTSRAESAAAIQERDVNRKREILALELALAADARAAAANARAEALERERDAALRLLNMSRRARAMALGDMEMKQLRAEYLLSKAVVSLRRLDEATAINTNSESADRAFSFVHAVAATALAEIEGKSK